MKMPSATARRYLYRVGIAGVAVAVGYGLLTQEYAVLWVVLLGALLGLADANVPATIETLNPEE